MTLRALLTAAMLVPAGPMAAHAVGGETGTPPTGTPTTLNCEQGKIFDTLTGKCVAPQESRLDDETLYRAAREFAYAGQFEHALGALAAMSDQADDRVMTYKGFAYRRLGQPALGLAYYRQAIARNPGNLLARSYMGQGFAEAGDLDAARIQLTEIRGRGGRNTWAEFSLRRAIETGRGAGY